jgi:hypothetical protein
VRGRLRAWLRIQLSNSAALREAVILRESGASGTPQLLGSFVETSEYWITRSSRVMTSWSLPAAHCARVVA